MKKIEQVLQELEERVNDCYEGLIAIHNNAALQGLTEDTVLPIVRGKYNSSRTLYYQNGFKANIPKCVEKPSYCDNGRYKARHVEFYEKNGVLQTDIEQKTYTLLGLFPPISVEYIEDKIVEEIKKLPIYQRCQ